MDYAALLIGKNAHQRTLQR